MQLETTCTKYGIPPIKLEVFEEYLPRAEYSRDIIMYAQRLTQKSVA